MIRNSAGWTVNANRRKLWNAETLIPILTFAVFSSNALLVAESPPVEFAVESQRLRISIGGKPFADYYFEHETTPRPFLTGVRAPNGVQVTRSFPPREGVDATDHATMHPGIWLAFGDLSGADFWRNRAAVKHSMFLTPPAGGEGAGHFTARNLYESEGTVVCEETSAVHIDVRPAGYLIRLDSTFASPSGFYFGDQEEMGLGVRVATPLSVGKGGRIVNSDGLMNEKQVWGKQADWCDYGGQVEDQPVGVVLIPHPKNFRRCWFHARDYGLLVANPFGLKAFTGGEASKETVQGNESFRLRFGILVYAGNIDAEAAYRDYLHLAGQTDGPAE